MRVLFNKNLNVSFIPVKLKLLTKIKFCSFDITIIFFLTYFAKNHLVLLSFLHHDDYFSFSFKQSNLFF